MNSQKPSLLNIGREKDFFIENLSMLLASNMDIISVINAISLEIKSNRLKEILNQVKDDISGGSPIWRALDESRLLPDHIVTLIKIGEQTGRLPENLNIVVMQQKKERLLKSKITSALIYPTIVLVMTVVVGISISWFILPKLARVFKQLHLQLPLITKIFIGFGSLLSNYGVILVPAFFIFLGALFYFLFVYSKTKFVGQRLLFVIPAIRNIIQQVEIARFGFIFGTLLKAGLPITDAIDSVKQSSSFEQYQKFYTYLQSSIEEGNSFKKSFTSYPKVNVLVPPSIQQLLISSEQSGKLADTLIQIGDTYEIKTDTSTKNLSVLIEPILLVIIWLGVVCLAIAVILPIYSLIGGFNNGVTKPTKQNSPQPVPTLPTARQTDKTVTASSASQLKISPISTVPNKSLGQIEILRTDSGLVNVRKDPTTKSELLQKIKSGEQYEFYQRDSAWYQIIVDGQTGWVYGQFAKEL